MHASMAVPFSFLLLAAADAQAGPAVDESLDAGSEVTIDVRRGSVTVIGWDERQVHVSGTRDDRSEGFVFERDGESVRVEDQVPDDARGGDGTRITVKLPRSNDLRVTVVSADLDVQEIEGRARLRTVSGDVAARALGGDANVNSVSGDLTIAHGGESLRVDTVSGEVEVNTRARSIDVESVSGDVAIRNQAALSQGRLSSVSGDLELATAFDADGDLSLETVSGDIALALRGEVDARVEIDAGPGGSIENRMGGEDEVKRSARGPMQSLRVRLGGGRGDIELSTLSGDIELRPE